jgi:hypothetical protein
MSEDECSMSQQYNMPRMPPIISKRIQSIGEVYDKVSSIHQIQDGHSGSRIAPEIERNLLLCIPITPQQD